MIQIELKMLELAVVFKFDLLQKHLNRSTEFDLGLH